MAPGLCVYFRIFFSFLSLWLNVYVLRVSARLRRRCLSPMQPHQCSAVTAAVTAHSSSGRSGFGGGMGSRRRHMGKGGRKPCQHTGVAHHLSVSWKKAAGAQGWCVENEGLGLVFLLCFKQTPTLLSVYKVRTLGLYFHSICLLASSK